MSDLQQYVATWWDAIGSFTALADGLAESEWDLPTDLPGWDVRAVVSHVAHLEGILGGAPEEADPFASEEVPVPPHAAGPMGRFTEIGVLTRRETEPGEIVAQIRRYAGARHEQLLADPPTDPTAPAPGIFGAIGWSTATLLRNRPLDVWMHEQDIRRAVGRPGGLDSPGAAHAATYLLESLPFVLGKRVRATPGATLVAEVEGHGPTAVAVDESGRGVLLPEPPAAPTATLRMDRETFLLLAGGRRPDAARDVACEGDAELAERVLSALAVTP